MNKYTYRIAIQEKSQGDADTKAEALSTLAAMLTSKELARLAQVVKTDPVKTALAKQYLGV